MPIAYELDWFSGAGTLAARVYADSGDVLHVVASGGINATGPIAAPSVSGVVNTSIYADQAQNIASAATGGSMTVANGVSWQIYNPSGTLATFTTTMPPNPVNGQDIYFSTDNMIIAWTLLPNAGQAVSGAPGTLASTQSVHFRWNSPTGYWFRM
jgi:hypothetical protein